MVNQRPKHRTIPSMTYSDWEGEQSEAPYLSDSLPPPPTARTDMELNLSVLRRHNPSVVNLHHVSPYAVVYEFSPTLQTWEKAGIEGSAFIVSLLPTQAQPLRFAVMVLNRRGLDNFELELQTPDDIEVTEEYLILQSLPANGDSPIIFGLWIFAEAPPASTATQREEVASMALRCAEQVSAARRSLAQDLPQLDRTHEPDPENYVEDMARSGSLTATLEQQRHADDGWSIRSHSPSTHHIPQLQQQPPSAGYVPSFAPTADTDFFLSARPHGTGTRTTPSPAVSTQGSISAVGHKEDLLDLFKRAGDNYRGTVD